MREDLNVQTISVEDHKRISTAIKDAEIKTSGEIFAVIAKQSDDYFFVAGFMAALWALLFGLIIALGAFFLEYSLTVIVLASAQLASFAATLGIFWLFPEVKRHFVPRSIAYKRASNNAVRQFLAHGIHTTEDRSGVLIFVTLSERYAEIVADAGINAKVDQSQWDSMVSSLVQHAGKGDVAEGFLETIEQAGALLAEHFPPQDGQSNELDDHLIEL